MRSQRDDVVAVSRGIDGSADIRARFLKDVGLWWEKVCRLMRGMRLVRDLETRRDGSTMVWREPVMQSDADRCRWKFFGLRWLSENLVHFNPSWNDFQSFSSLRQTSKRYLFHRWHGNHSHIQTDWKNGCIKQRDTGACIQWWIPIVFNSQSTRSQTSKIHKSHPTIYSSSSSAGGTTN
jgi:hypothetical protein